MSLTSSLRRPVAAAALGAALLTASAGVASAATVSDPVVVKPGAKIAIDFPGYKEPANRLLPANFRIVKRTVELQPGESANVRLTAPAGFGLVTLGLSDPKEGLVGGAVKDVHYGGKRSVTLKLVASKRNDDTARRTVYALAKRV